MLGRMFSGLSLLLVAIAVFGSLIAQDVVSHFLDKRYLSAGQLIPWIIGGYLFHAPLWHPATFASAGAPSCFG